MDLEHLRLFLRIVDTGSVSAAARLSHLTQPAVSRNLKLLEESLGTLLFERVGRGLVLTAAGRALVPRARALLYDAEQAAHAVQRATARGYFDLRLGTVDSVASWLLPPLVEPLQGAFPELQIKLRTGRSAALVQAVEAGQLDLALVAWSGPPPAERAVALGPYQLQFFGRADLFPALAEVTEPDGLKRFPIVEIESLPGQPTLIADDAPAYAVAFSLGSVKALVLAGFGIGAMLRFMLTDAEAARLVTAALPTDPGCQLYAVAGPPRQDVRARQLEDALFAGLRARVAGALLAQAR